MMKKPQKTLRPIQDQTHDASQVRSLFTARNGTDTAKQLKPDECMCQKERSESICNKWVGFVLS